MSITELIEQLKALPEKMEGFNSEGELVVLNTHKIAEKLKKSLRNCDVGTAEEQEARFNKFCFSYYNINNLDRECNACPLNDNVKTTCEFAWMQMPYGEGGAKC